MYKITKVIIMLFCITISSFTVAVASEAKHMGAYLGSIPIEISFSNRNGYPLHYGTWTTNMFLYKNKIEFQTWIDNEKNKLVNKALTNAKKYAETKGYKFFAIDHINYHIIHNETKIELYIDCNLIVWQ